MIAIVTIRSEPAYRRRAIETGLKRLGYTLVKDGVPSGPADLLVSWGRKRGPEEKRAEAWERAGGTVVVLENGYLAKEAKTHYAMSTHDHAGAGWFPVGAEYRFGDLGFELKPMTNRNGYWLVIGQRGIGSALMASPPRWAEEKAKVLGMHAYGMKLRPHPGNWAPKVPLLTDLAGAGGVAIWSSAAGVQALVEGIHVSHSAPHWICEGWMTDRGEHRSAALNRMAHGQWHHEEIARGEPFARMQAENWGPRWTRS